jgi:hypothetical protein
LTLLEYIDFDQCSLTGSIDLSGLPNLRGFDFSGNVDLTEIVISSSQPLGDGYFVYAYNCALTEESVDNILVALSTNGVNSAEVDLSGGTNAIPSSTGLAAIAVLQGNGWTVYVNVP